MKYGKFIVIVTGFNLNISERTTMAECKTILNQDFENEMDLRFEVDKFHNAHERESISYLGILPTKFMKEKK